MGEVNVVYDGATEERCGGKAVKGSPAPLKWRCVGQRCREEQHLRPINQSHQNHIITTFPDTLISCFTWARKMRLLGEESEKAISNNPLCLLLLPTHNMLLILG